MFELLSSQVPPLLKKVIKVMTHSNNTIMTMLTNENMNKIGYSGRDILGYFGFHSLHQLFDKQTGKIICVSKIIIIQDRSSTNFWVWGREASL
jgi:predicted site-specific integrase-resolvase